MVSVHDRSYWKRIEKIYGTRGRNGIINDRIKMSVYAGPRKETKEDILDYMLDRHNNYIAEGILQSGHVLPCATFLGAPPLDRDRILEKLDSHRGHASLRNWNHWAGTHRGRWIKNLGTEFQDDAIWYEAEEHEIHSDGTPYFYQRVDFLNPDGTIKRQGWNQSHPAIDFVWGYDPKPGAEHCGIKFRQGGQRGIFWFTRRECYLEIVYQDRGLLKRTSTGLHGVGQWVIEREEADQPSSMGTITGTGTLRRAIRRP